MIKRNNPETAESRFCFVPSGDAKLPCSKIYGHIVPQIQLNTMFPRAK